jgi:amino acid adenylation domain-containing protein
MSDVTERLARLSQEERALLFEKLRRKKEQEAPPREEASASIPRRTDPGSPPPLSFAQQRLWFLHRVAPEDPVYNVPMAALVRGPLDRTALRRALAAVCSRHESLRTTFAVLDGAPVQLIAPALEIPLPMVDLACQANPEIGEIDRLCRDIFNLPFDLSAGPLVRAALLRLAPERHVLVLVQHHVVSDGWSVGILIRDLLALYRAALRGDDPCAALPPLSIQYADFSLWQRQWLSGERLEQQLAVWRRRLGDLPPPLELPIDHPRPPLKSSRGAADPLHLYASETAGVHSLARREGTTPYMVLMSILQILLHRYTGQTDFAVGSVVANRSRPELKDLIGFFVNTLALRADVADVAGDLALSGLMARVREIALEAFAHQDLPFEKLVEELRPERDPSRTPIFQVSLSLLNTPKPPLDFGDLSLEVLHPDPGLVKFDLDLAFEPDDGGGLSGSLNYSTDLFEAATAARMVGHFRSLLAAALADCTRRVSELDMLGDLERRQLLDGWNRTAVEWPREGSPAGLVEAWAAARPGSPAVVSPAGAAGGVRVLTYGELDRRANRLAWRLRRLGVGPEVPVGSLVPRSEEMFLAALAVAKAGGAYLPLDPAYPDERIAAALDDAATPVVLTLGALAGRIGGARAVLAIDDAEIILGAVGAEGVADAGPPERRGASGNLAYIIFTSGSTGRPKGVAATRGALMNLLSWYRHALPVAPDDRCTLAAGPAFDGAVWELWALLTSGAAIHLPDEETRLSPSRLAGWLARERITMSFLPTPLGEAFLAEPDAAATSLRRLCMGGDRLHRIARRDLPFAVVNLYGPSEATVVTTFAPAVLDEREDRDPSVGRPIDNARVYLLDGHQQPLPVGVAGELWIGGEILARGYLGRPDLTAAVYRPDPFARVAGARMYRTGDLARRRVDGDIEVLGRLDGQVKIRGFRIELGEIESVLHDHPVVSQAVVLARDDGNVGGIGGGGRRLVAYLVLNRALHETAEAPEADLRAHLRRRLPEHMVPAVFVALPALPLVPGGKVDRQALGALPLPAVPAREPTAPRSETERLVAGLWSEVLGRDRVGVDESFFDLGGHSLLLARVQALLAERLDRQVPLLKLIELPTVGALAAWLDGEDGTAPAKGGESRDRTARQRQALELQRRRAVRRPAGG